MDFDAKLLLHIVTYGIGKAHNLPSSGSAAIDQHQRLLLIHTGTSKIAAFPPRLLNKPCGGHFHCVRPCHGIMRDIGVFGLQTRKITLANHGVHKETAGIANLFGVGQFIFAD